MEAGGAGRLGELLRGQVGGGSGLAEWAGPAGVGGALRQGRQGPQAQGDFTRPAEGGAGATEWGGTCWSGRGHEAGRRGRQEREAGLGL